MLVEIIILIVVLGIIIMLLFNNLVSKKNKVEGSLSTIDTYLQKRFDLMEELFATLERTLDHELEVYNVVTKNRTGFDEVRKAYESNKANPGTIVQSDKTISSIFQGMRMTSEQYPQLQSIQAVMTVMNQNITVENEINASRRQYNSNVTIYRNAIQSFPGVLIANILGFKDVYELYKADEEAKKRPKQMSEDYYKAKYEKKTEDIKSENE